MSTQPVSYFNLDVASFARQGLYRPCILSGAVPETKAGSWMTGTAVHLA